MFLETTEKNSSLMDTMLVGSGHGEKRRRWRSIDGRSVVREMSRVGVISDLAHSAWRTSLEAAAGSEKPVEVSHAVCHALSGMERVK